MNEIRVGRVSSIDYAAGTAKIAYPDKSSTGTADFPVFCGMKEYQMPKVDDQVLVLHLSNDSSIGIVMGRFWSAKTVPNQGTPGAYRKDLNDSGTAYIQMQDGGPLKIHADNLVLSGAAGSITLTDLITMKRKLDAL